MMKKSIRENVFCSESRNNREYIIREKKRNLNINKLRRSSYKILLNNIKNSINNRLENQNKMILSMRKK